MIDQVLTQARDNMRKAITIAQQDLGSIRSGRANPALVENIIVSAYEGTQRLRVMEMATITTHEAKSIVISPFDPSIIRDIEKGIMEAKVGLNPVIDGELIRISLPPLSEERRQEYVKLAKAKLESARIMVRQIRHEAMRDFKKGEEAKTIAEDERKHGEKKIQELTDEVIGELDNLGERKEAELMQV